MNRISLIRLIVPFVALCHSGAASAHEFWIDPQQYQVQAGDPLVADLRNGQNFEGISLAWFENRFTRFEMAMADTIRPVDGRMGDAPALSTVAQGDGLLIILHETTPSTLTYTEWDKFLAFAAHKDFPDAAKEHVANGWSQDRFRESYTRHAKALVSVGGSEGQDRAFGMETEFVARTNPYDEDFDDQMIVELLYQDAPRADAQVEVFDKAPDGDVTITLLRTDAQGMATVPVAPGHSYLFDAVVLRPSPDAGTSDTAAVWETLWAALTFAVPE